MLSMYESMIVYPVIALLWAGLLFLHLSIRTKASLVSFLIFTFLTTARSVIQVPDFVEIALLLIFCLAFFISTISIPKDANQHHKPALFGLSSAVHIPDGRLRTYATVSLALSLSAAIFYWNLAIHGASRTLGLLVALVALSGFVIFILLVGVIIRRRTPAKLGA